MFKDDVEALPKHIANTYDVQAVLAEQIKLIRRNLPLTLMGAIFTSVCFYISMFLTFDLSSNQKILNTIWLIYHTLIIGIWWFSWRRIFGNPEALSFKALRGLFGLFALLFVAALLFGLPVFVRMLYNTPITTLTSAKAMIFLWIFFHVVLIGVCGLNWIKIKALLLQQSEVSTTALSNNDTYRWHVEEEKDPSIVASQANYLAHYAAYNILLLSGLALGCLWALAVGKAFTANLQNSTQVIVIMGLQFGIMSGAISSIAMFLRVYIAFAIPSIFIWGFILFYLRDTGLTILAVAVIVLVLFDIFFAGHSWRNTLNAIVINLENNNLVAQLRIKTKQVEQASLAKTQFLAAASHDLRQPVHALSLFIEALIDTDLDSHQAQIVDYAKSASQSSREMLNTILDYAHVESGQMTPHFIPTDLDNIIRHLVDEFGIQAQSKGLSLRYKPTNTWVVTDPTMLALIIRNFISNAIRYTTKGGVVIGVRKVPIENQSIMLEYCRISVWDTGSGMTTDETEQIFESFYQIERNKTTDQGLGLGLAIVKGMTQMLKADLNVKSSLGIGSQFSVVLPTCLPVNNSTQRKNADIDHLKDKVVLVIDDDDAVLKSMQLLLGSWGCHPIAVQTLEEAVTAFDTYNPDIVITDFRLANGITGEDIIFAIKQSKHCTHATSFVFLTADTTPQLFTATKAIRPLILHKPIDPKNLRQQLQQVLAK